MVRLICVLLFVVGVASPALAQSEYPAYPSDEARIHALQEYAQGNFKPYEAYLKAELGWHLARLQHDSNLDLKKIAEGIKKYADQKKVTLTQSEWAEKVKTAELLYASSGRGQQRMLIDRARELCLALSRLYSMMSDDDNALAYRREAADFD